MLVAHQQLCKLLKQQKIQSKPEQMTANLSESQHFTSQKLARPSSQDKAVPKVPQEGNLSNVQQKESKNFERSQSVDPNKNQSAILSNTQQLAVTKGCGRFNMQGIPENIQGIMTKSFGSNIYPRDFEKTGFKDRIMLDEYTQRVAHTGFGRTAMGGFYRRW